MIPLDSRPGFIWLDGSLWHWNEARLHVLSHGLHYATTAFEGVRIYNKKPFKLGAHLDRLFYSCKVVGITLSLDRNELEEEVLKYVDLCGHGDAYLRPIAWRGSEELGIVGNAGSSHLALACWPWKGPHVDGDKDGISVVPGLWRRPPPESWPLQAKLSGLYSIGSINAITARREGYEDALVLAPDGLHIAELTGANIFFVEDGMLYTPDTTYALNGITRQTVIELAQSCGIEVIVGPIAMDAVDRFKGAFATGTAYELMPINRIGRKSFDLLDAKFLSIFDHIHRSYKSLTESTDSYE